MNNDHITKINKNHNDMWFDIMVKAPWGSGRSLGEIRINTFFNGIATMIQFDIGKFIILNQQGDSHGNER